MSRIGVLKEVDSATLETIWRNGMEGWWSSAAANASTRRDLLFRLWGAVAELQEDPQFQDAQLCCVRTAGGSWIAVSEAAYFREALPTANEPGGAESRRFIESYLPDISSCIEDGWLPGLRQAAAKESRGGPMTAAAAWLEKSGRAIDLRAAVESAVKALASSEVPDWNILIPFGRWVLHRQSRTDLLTHVLADGPNGPTAVPVSESLIADPYVERGQSRRQLFPDKPTISAAYLERTDQRADAHDWRRLFEQAGACSSLRLRPIEDHAGRYQKGVVAEFLGVDVKQVGESNNSGYQLIDVDVEPPLPGSTDPLPVRAALAGWLEDGFSAFRFQGHRRARYFYGSQYETRGQKPARWRAKLEDVCWVPCQDGVLREPRDVLPRLDPTRADSPVAQLSEELIQGLLREGLIFGSAIPEAPALSRLVAIGSQLAASELVAILREIRVTQIGHGDAEKFSQAARQLTVPTRRGDRIPLERLVRKVGSPHRGSLGGWVCQLEDLDEQLQAELASPGFPHDIPPTTTGRQSFAYIRDVWMRARVAPGNLASEVRDILPVAYAYCLTDQGEDKSLDCLWQSAKQNAAVFAGREWVVIGETSEKVFFDDLDDRRYYPSEVRFKIATGGHLGNDSEQQRRTAQALGLLPLSSAVSTRWNVGNSQGVGEWASRFETICTLLSSVRRSDTVNDEAEVKASIQQAYSLRRVDLLGLAIQIEGGPPEDVSVNARLDGQALTVVGAPVQFAADAAKELLRGFGFRQRGELAADLTGMFAAIDDDKDFSLAVEKFARSSGAKLTGLGGKEGTDVEKERRHRTTATQGAKVGAQGQGETDEEGRKAGGNSGSYDQARAIAQEAQLVKQLQQVRKGEIVPLAESEKTGAAEDERSAEDDELGDELYREIAAAYERQFNREPQLGDPHQVGWDLSSRDPKSGVVRRIEVKGKGVPWTANEVVELSRAQVRSAFETIINKAQVEWFLYVIERSGPDVYTVVPIENPAAAASKWILVGGAWRLVANDVRDIEWPTSEIGRDQSLAEAEIAKV